jgi:hypothetical protein
MQGGRKQYGLQLQIKGPPKKSTARPAPAAAFRFNDGDNEDDVEADIARQANKKRNVREVICIARPCFSRICCESDASDLCLGFTGHLTWGSNNCEQVEQQYQKALEEDPNAFDYDGVYDEMKGNQARPIHEDREKREVGAIFFPPEVLFLD